MAETKVEFKVSEFLAELNKISLMMQTGDGESFYELRDFLRLYEDQGIQGIFEFSALMPKPAFTVLWLLTQFVLHELGDNFGGDTPGFPVKEGEPLLHAIIADLGHFIQDSVFGPGSSISRFADALMAYAKLVRIISERVEISSFDPKDWRKL